MITDFFHGRPIQKDLQTEGNKTIFKQFKKNYKQCLIKL